VKTAEAVSFGHVDKICDQISDAIVDACLEQDPDSRCAIETMGGHGIITITGELTTKAYVDMAGIAKKVYREIGYTDEIGVQVNVVSQSPDIAQGVDTGGAGDQGIVVGYACNDNEEMIPRELYLARKLLKGLPKEFGPDAKSQITLDDDGDIIDIVLSAQHKEDQDIKPLKDYAVDFASENGDPLKEIDLHVNPTGKFVQAGFSADTGVTGRKIVNDAYGPQVPVGGGAYSGKDGSKVDRSAAYMARKIAVDLLKEIGCDNVMVKIAYSIGIAEPLMATAVITDEDEGMYMRETRDLLLKNDYNLTPKGIIKFLDLKRPIYRKTAEWGAYGNKEFPWEK
jgi:S-adenosylmethionine synthetase